MAPKTNQNLRRFSRAKKLLFKSLLEPSWADLGAFWRPSWGQKKCFRIGKRNTGGKINVFDVDKLSRRVLDRTWPNLAAKSAENDPKMVPQNDPKSTKNRCQKMIKILIEKKEAIVRFGGWPGGLRGALGGKIRGVSIRQ